ncbi:transcriptional regulator [Saccharothrix obliqua]|uniref:transcriptional regulator n=1 Tax=Saccharothrix obliqua TaxID=2861747 RepID=UPI001C5FCA3C|nr:transcriptional regulator [Saccharothrix obliqua]MBW4718384.1 transcriptional regulator [Saccharothrix obliqua]
MADSARELLDRIRREVAGEHGENRFLPLVAAGRVPVGVIGALAAEESRIVPGDWRAFLTLAARAEDPAGRAFFSGLAQGESLALPLLPPLAAAAGLDEHAVRAYRPRPGCQAYAAYVGWLALNARPEVAALAMLTNFAEFGAYCGSLAGALREHYGFADDAVAFFEFFGSPVPELEEQGLAAVQAGLDAGVSFDGAVEIVRLLQGFELLFWNTLAELAGHPAG